MRLLARTDWINLEEEESFRTLLEFIFCQSVKLNIGLPTLLYNTELIRKTITWSKKWRFSYLVVNIFHLLFPCRMK